MPTLELGPLMSAVLEAQRYQADALRYPEIDALAAEVVHLARAWRCDLLWPADLGAHKLVGAVEVVASGEIDVRSYVTEVAGRSVLLVATVAVSGVDLAREAKAAQAAGARSVHGCAIDPRCEVPGLESFTLVRPRTGPVRRSA